MNTALRENTQDFLHLFLNDIPLMDVRAPIEFNQGAFPFTKNCPLLDDEQRADIGTRYKNSGQEEAIQLGLELATPAIRAQRLAQWGEFCKAKPEGYLYCFRGGLRSRTTQQWLKETGINYPLVTGGYKAMRRFLLEQMEVNSQEIPLILLAGPTGSGKTRVLKKLENFIDFEGLAEHRGSAFGRTLDAQPSQIDWENKVSIALLKHQHKSKDKLPLIIEDEGRLIGRIALPHFLQTVMKQSNLIVLQQDLPSRVALIREDYIEQPWPKYQTQFGDQAFEKFSEFVLGNLLRIRKRLGGLQHQQLERILQRALDKLHEGNDTSAFDEGIQRLLEEYYDPMYRYQLEQRKGRILFSGNEVELRQWVESYSGLNTCS